MAYELPNNDLCNVGDNSNCNCILDANEVHISFTTQLANALHNTMVAPVPSTTGSNDNYPDTCKGVNINSIRCIININNSNDINTYMKVVTADNSIAPKPTKFSDYFVCASGTDNGSIPMYNLPYAITWLRDPQVWGIDKLPHITNILTGCCILKLLPVTVRFMSSDGYMHTGMLPYYGSGPSFISATISNDHNSITLPMPKGVYACSCSNKMDVGDLTITINTKLNNSQLFGNATVDQVLSGYTFSSSSGFCLTGTIKCYNNTTDTDNCKYTVINGNKGQIALTGDNKYHPAGACNGGRMMLPHYESDLLWYLGTDGFAKSPVNTDLGTVDVNKVIVPVTSNTSICYNSYTTSKYVHNTYGTPNANVITNVPSARTVSKGSYIYGNELLIGYAPNFAGNNFYVSTNDNCTTMNGCSFCSAMNSDGSAYTNDAKKSQRNIYKYGNTWAYNGTQSISGRNYYAVCVTNVSATPYNYFSCNTLSDCLYVTTADKKINDSNAEALDLPVVYNPFVLHRSAFTGAGTGIKGCDKNSTYTLTSTTCCVCIPEGYTGGGTVNVRGLLHYNRLINSEPIRYILKISNCSTYSCYIDGTYGINRFYINKDPDNTCIGVYLHCFYVRKVCSNGVHDGINAKLYYSINYISQSNGSICTCVHSTDYPIYLSTNSSYKDEGDIMVLVPSNQIASIYWCIYSEDTHNDAVSYSFNADMYIEDSGDTYNYKRDYLRLYYD